MAAQGYFTVPDAYDGQSLSQIAAKGGLPFRPDVLAGLVGVNQNQPLTKGQSLAYSGNIADQGSGELQSLNQLFGAPTTPELHGAQEANQFQITANAPAISAVGSAITNTQGAYGSAVTQYQGEIPTLQKSYQDVLNQISKGVNASYAQRGLSNESPQMSLDTANAQLPATNQQSGALNQFLNSIAGIQTSGAGAVSNLQQILGGLQSGNPLASLQQGITSAMLPYNQAEAQAQAALGSAQAAASSYVPIPNLGVYNTGSGNIISPYSGAASGYILGADGHYYQKVA